MRWRAAAVLGLLIVGALVLEGWRLLTPAPGIRRAGHVVEIPPSAGVDGIARRLADAGVVRSPWDFIALSVVRGTARSLKAGEYEIPAGATTVQILALIESGRVRQHPLLHPEGATVAELARAVEAAGLARAADVQRVARDPAFLQAHRIDAPSAEGYVFPDTYYFVRGMTAEQILGRMVQRLQARLTPDLRARAAERNLSLHALLTLASIVEREAVAHQERPLIAAVFWNRLKLGMPLQADPTVQYAVGRERGTLRRSDLQQDHPYNTYQRTGLPPGPIASPGLDAIRATLEPAPVPYLYFVKKDDQHHHFSTTVEEHNRAVTQYRLARSR
jgi:UPF0755 protein